MRKFTIGLSGVLAVALLAGCDQAPTDDSVLVKDETSVESVHHPAAATGIQWYSGSVDEAFAAASAESKPLFLYWGAVWCPPCNVLKSTVFKDPEFIAVTDQFVPVYLDGDTPRAQKYGDQFGIAGYPTVLLFNSSGTETTRIPGGTAPDDYRAVLQLALQSNDSVKSLLAPALAGETLTDEGWQQLAWYAWDQDGGQVLGERDSLSVFSALIPQCPENLTDARVRLQLLAMVQWLKKQPFQPEDGESYLAAVHEAINSKKLSRENLSILLGLSAEDIAALAPEKNEAFKLMVNLTAREQRLVDDASLSATERLDLLGAKIQIQKASEPDTPLPESLLAEVRETVAREDALATTHYQRQALINSATYLLEDAGLEQEAMALLEAEIAKSEAPYYFMSSLAYREMKRGNYDNGLMWSEKAWNSASGPATRAQWGTSYLMNLLKAVPEEVARIAETEGKLLSELAAGKDSLFGRSHGRMVGLNSALTEWAKEGGERRAVLAAFQQKLQTLCSEQGADCQFLNGA